jgi:hypothetical protein
MTRVLQPELLDELPVDDPRARRSRRDLRRVNFLMGNPIILAGALRGIRCLGTPIRLLELGAGDGTLLLNVARRLHWPSPVEAELLDRQELISAETRAGFRMLGWNCTSLLVDLHKWVQEKPKCRRDVVSTNLFLHHFPDGFLRELFACLAESVDYFVAVEPRRSPWSIWAGGFLGLLGCNDVTRHDARISIRAGFDDQQLSALWPSQSPGWELTEKRSGPFSHLFIARRTQAGSTR